MASNDAITVNIAFNYGGRADIVRAVQRLVAEGVSPEQVTEEAIAERLWTVGVPDPDLLIRTGAVRRISNFLIWQAAYSEFYFCDLYWPDFDEAAFDKALSCFCSRERRYGGLDAKAN